MRRLKANSYESQASVTHGARLRRLCIEKLENRRMLATFTVTNFDDAGIGSLREAIEMANASAGEDSISFESSGTVLISSQLPTITDSLTIFGPNPQPSSNRMTISAGHGPDGVPGTGDGFRIFDIDNGSSSQIDVELRFFLITGGDLGTVEDGGGAIRNRENLALSSMTIFDNAVTGAGGGAIFSSGGSVNLHNTDVRNNVAANGPGGGIFSSQGEVRLRSSSVAENRTSGDLAPGGGIAMDRGALTIFQATVNDNSTSGSGSNGGGISVDGALLELEFGSVTGNATSGDDAHGGGIFSGGNLPTQTTVTITNSTLSENSAIAGYGGGLYNAGDNTTIKHVTIANNQAASGGGLASAGTAIAMTRVGHTIIAENGDHELAISNGETDSFESLGYNLIGSDRDFIGEAEAFITDETNLIGIDPEIGPLLNNGFSSKTHALDFDSPAVNAGEPNISDLPFPPSDQRLSRSRVFDGRIDIGAFEVNLDPIVVTNLNDDGPGSLRQAILDANDNGFRVEDAIVFAHNLTGTIHLESSLPKISNPLSIVGPGADRISIDGGGGSNPSEPDANGFRLLEIGFRSGSPEDVKISGLTFTGGDHNQNGGAIASFWDLTIHDSVITGNAGNLGGGVYQRNGSLTLLNSNVSQNAASQSGGGIVTFSLDDTLIQDSTVDGNTATTGGGIANFAGEISIANSTISGNSATITGGGIYNARDSFLTIRTATVSGNSSSYGAGLTNLEEARVLSSTIAANISNRSSRGIENNGSRLSLFNSIVEGEVTHFDMGSDLTGSNNLFGATSDNFPIVGTNNLFNLDPRLGPLEENGGLTKTHALLVGSPALDAGNISFQPGTFGVPIVNDQRGAGYARIADGDGSDGPRLDIGAFESQESLTVLPGDFDGDDAVSYADLTVWEDSYGNSVNADADNDGDSDGSDFLIWQRNLTEFRLLGDFDGDEDIDHQDLRIWESSYGISDLGDADGDGDSDGRDFLLWQSNLTAVLSVNAFESGNHSHSAYVAQAGNAGTSSTYQPGNYVRLDGNIIETAQDLSASGKADLVSTASLLFLESAERTNTLPSGNPDFVLSRLEDSPILIPGLFFERTLTSPRSMTTSSHSEDEETSISPEELLDSVFDHYWA